MFLSKKILTASYFITLLMLSQALFAQKTGDFGVSLGFEDNGNTRKGRAAALTLALQYSPLNWLSAGIRGGFSHDFNTIMTAEGAGTLRWTFARPGGIPLFAEGFAGASYIYADEDRGKSGVLFSGGAIAGARFAAGRFYAEPFAGYGYPKGFAAGFNIGCVFQTGNRSGSQAAGKTEEAAR